MSDTTRYTVRILPRNITIEAGGDESVLEAALRQGLNLPHSCRGGSCMACKAQLESGQVSYPGDTLPLGLNARDAAGGAALLCQARARSALVLRARENELADEVRIRRMPCRVVRMERLAADVMGLFLKPPKVEPLVYRAGQYIDIILPDGRRRSFSIANAPHDSELLELHVRHVPGGGFTGHVFDAMQEKALLRIEGPLGNFYLREKGTAPIVMVAGGTGWAPVRAMLSHILHIGLERPVTVYWGVRDLADAYEHQWLLDWQNRDAGRAFHLVLSEPGADRNHRTGLVHQAVMEDLPDMDSVDVYASGPPPMVEAVRRDFAKRGANPERIFSDSFEYGPDVLAALAKTE